MLYKYELFFMISAVMEAEQLDRLVVFLQRAFRRHHDAVVPFDPAILLQRLLPTRRTPLSGACRRAADAGALSAPRRLHYLP